MSEPALLDGLKPASQRVLEIDPSEAKLDPEKPEVGKKVNPGPPSHALLEIGDDASPGIVSEPMEDGQPQHLAGQS